MEVSLGSDDHLSGETEMADHEYEYILYEKRDRIATITFNRPKVFNAINVEICRIFAKESTG